MATRKSRPRKLPSGARAIKGSRKEPQYCGVCGHPIIPDSIALSPIRERILNAIERHGEIRPDILHSAIWGSDPNGGPDKSVLHVHIWHLNKCLAPHGLAVRRTKSGAGGAYKLVAEPGS